MAEQRLIDATSLKVLFEHEYSHNKQFKQSSVYKAWQGAIQLLYDQPTIDPETLHIVRQLREELARVTEERDAAIKDMETAMRFDYADDIWSFLCSVCENKFPDGKCSCVGDDCVPKWRGLQKEEK